MSTAFEDLEDLDAPSTQLLTDLRTSMTHALSSRRPILTHLNADTTWLLSLPIPLSHPRRKKRLYFHILIDPWLAGPQSDVAAFFSTQWHAIDSCCQSIAGVEDVIRGIEEIAAGSPSPAARTPAASRPNLKRMETEDVIVVDADPLHQEEGMDINKHEQDEAEEEERWIDAVLISHEFTDHMHQPTLLTLSPGTPIFATSKAFSAICSWKHFRTVRQIGRFSGDWKDGETGEGRLPDWMGVHRVAYAGNDLLYYHSAILICFSRDGKDGAEAEAEAILYTPHGISPSDLEPLTTAKPGVEILALLHGLQDISLEGFWKKAQLNMGAHNGLRVVRMLGVKYWVGTHDENKRGGGVVGWFLHRVGVSIEDALKGEAEGGKGREEVRFVEVGNGESLVLE
jgi:hypothetical protein